MKDLEILNLAKEMGKKEIWIRRRCPWCHQFRLYLKLDQNEYECHACERYGDVKKLKELIIQGIMEEKSSVDI